MSYESVVYICQLAAMAIFGALMLAILIHAFRPANKARFERAAQLPLEDHEDDEGSHGR